MAFSIRLYTNTAEKNRIVKNDYVTRVMELNGVLKAPTSISNPSVVIETANGIQDLTKVNYAYCFQFHRWYFIVDMISISTKLTQLNLKCDVLMSFRTDLMLNTGMVARNEFDYDALLFDNEMPYEVEKEVIEYVPAPMPNSLVNTTFSDALSKYSYHIVFSNVVTTREIYLADGQTRALQYEPEQIFAPLGSGLPDINTYSYVVSNNTIPFITTPVTASLMIYALTTTESNQAPFVKSIIAYPFIVPKNTTESRELNIYAGNSGISETGSMGDFGTGYYAKSTISDYLVVAHFMMPNATKYDDFNPYTKYELFLPFLSYIELPFNQCKGHEIIVFYIVNYENNQANVSVWDVTAERYIFTSACKLGVEIALTKTNLEQLRNQETADTLNYLIGSLVNITNTAGDVMGAKSEGDAIGSAIKGVGKYFTDTTKFATKMVLYHEQASVSFGGNTSALYSPLQVRLKITKPIRTITSSSNVLQYAHQYGLPLMQPRLLSNLHGFTTFDDIHLEHLENAFSNEIDELYSLLRSGVIFPPVTP